MVGGAIELFYSDYCYDVEMQEALRRQAAGEALVIPILLRPCDWQTTPFGELQALPKDGKPVTLWSNRDAAFTDIAKGIRKRVERLAESSGAASRARSVKSVPTGKGEGREEKQNIQKSLFGRQVG